MVSIIMPSYNTGKFIAETIDSVIRQTYTDWELIIVDDCSTDDTREVLSSLCHDEAEGRGNSACSSDRIRVFYNDANRGAAFCRNLALREARGKYIAFLDSDDVWFMKKLELQVAFMESNGFAFTYTNYEEMDEEGRLMGVVVTGPAHITKTGMYNYCWPGCLTVMYDREVVGDIQIADIKKNNDYAMWLKAIRKADCHLLPESLAKYRKRTGSISHGEGNQSNSHCEGVARGNPKRLFSQNRYFSLIKWHYKLYREAEGMNPITSLWITARNLMFGVYKKMKYVGRG